jgi:outer membrane receptor for ferrienterochelin and colicins
VGSGETVELNFELAEETMGLSEVVITGTRTSKKQSESAVMVNVLDSKSLQMVQACNISEGLRFQPGLRVEVDCQTCNYTQLRMNGLGGSYSQILINGRPIFSPLTGMYGMEQIPANMVERIEVVRGGGSALYGSSAVGGTVNVITRIPESSSYDLSYTLQSIAGQALDRVLTGNLTMVTPNQNAGMALFVNRRNRDLYDHNGDNFSEMPELLSNSFGANLFFLPGENQKLELNLMSLNEYRYGGEMVNKPPHLAQQSEERRHDVVMGGLDYQINFNDDNSAFIAYAAGQLTDRLHYTGIFPDDSAGIAAHLTDPPYGFTDNTTLQVGAQVNHRVFDFIGSGSNVLTAGVEYLYDDVLDSIPAYNYVIDQTARTLGAFFQSDWEMLPRLNLLAGLRLDKHNLVDNLIASPRVSLLYNLRNYMQFRATWGTGFRAPQAFDTDMHIAFANGGVSRITLSPDLTYERSNSLSGSVNYDKLGEAYAIGFTLEGFYTRLNRAFFLQPVGSDAFGLLFEKQNGPGASVQGGTLELRGNYRSKVQLEAGLTLQTSLFNEGVENIGGLEPVREFLRTPNEYGYFTLSLMPDKRFNASLSGVYTGSMKLAHFAGAPEQPVDEYVQSPSFFELNLKLGYTIPMKIVSTGLEVFGGVKNLTNAFQDDFDTGKNRDSGYVYGPAAPRTIFFGLRLLSI